MNNGSSPLLKQKVQAVAIVIILLTLPIAVYLGKQKQDIRQKATSTMAIGVNITGITHYGYNDLLPYSRTIDVDKNLRALRQMGATIIRVFAANNRISDQEASRRLGELLNKAQNYNISVIVSFIDFYKSGFYPQSTEQYYTGNFNGTLLLGPEFFTTGYNQGYKQFVQTVVNDNKNKSNIYAWELGNELKSDNPESFVNFVNDMSSFIKTQDPTRRITIGMLNAAHIGLSAQNLYSRLSNIDIITIHTYNADHTGQTDALWATQNNKQFIVEEFGFSGIGNRTASYNNDINFWKDLGASAILQWGFIAKGISDNGNGDQDLGMDALWHCADYNTLFNLFQTTVNLQPTTLSTSCTEEDIYTTPTPTPAVTPTAIPTATIAPTIQPTLFPTTPPTATPAPIPPTNTPVPPTSCIIAKNQGNANNDCNVDRADYNIWMAEFIAGSGTQADFDGNGTTNLVDFDIWRNRAYNLQ